MAVIQISVKHNSPNGENHDSVRDRLHEDFSSGVFSDSIIEVAPSEDDTVDSVIKLGKPGDCNKKSIRSSILAHSKIDNIVDIDVIYIP